MRIDVYNRTQAERLEPRHDAVVISISIPGKPAMLRHGWADVLRLEFHDIMEQWEVDTEGLTIFTPEMAAQVQRFAELHKAFDFVVHCHAGFSRSVAVGIYLRDVYEGELHTHAITHLQAANSHVLRTLMRAHWEKQFNE